MKMKPNLCAFLLLFLLLLHQSLFATGFSIDKSIFKKPMKWLKGKKVKPEWDNPAYDYIREKFSSSPQLGKPMKGLSLFKQYFSSFGYLESSGPFNDLWDQPTASAFQAFKRTFNLTSKETLELFLRPRCAIPDMGITYNFTGNESLPKAGHQWFQKRNLTYGFLPGTEIPAKFKKVFTDAFTRWANATGFWQFTETTFDDADIKVGLYNFTEGVAADDLFGVSLIRNNPPSNVKTAEIGIDGNMNWSLTGETDSLSWKNGILDLETVAMHEIGHVLGFDHSFMSDSVMYPYIVPSQQRKVELSDSDKDNIKQLAKVTTGAGGCLGVPSMTTLSLGFAYLLLMY